MKRKDFLKTACSACGMGILSGILLSESSCAPKTGMAATKLVPQQGKLIIPLSAMENTQVQIFKVKGMEDLGMVKKNDGSYLAFEMKCTHQGMVLKIRDGKFACPAHGSIFSLEGKVEKGPAKFALKQFKTTVTSTDIEVII
jgi:Rieske Fe-S protein